MPALIIFQNVLRRFLRLAPLLAVATCCAAAEGGGLGGAIAEQLAAEIEVAPLPVLDEFSRNDAKLRQFVAGKLHDDRAARLARDRGLGEKPAVRAAIGNFERDALARAVFTEYLESERLKLPPLEPLARQYYYAHLSDYEVPEAIRVAHILVAADVEKFSDEDIAARRATAQELLGRVRAGEDFAALAREYSDDKGSAGNGGELKEAVSKGKLVPPFEKAAWALKVGETSGLVRTRFGYHIIRLLELKPKSARPFDEVKDVVMQKVQDDILAPRRAEFINSLRDESVERGADSLLPGLRDVVAKAIATRVAMIKASSGAAEAPGVTR